MTNQTDNKNKRIIKICYLPGRESGYARTRVLLKGMRDVGLTVLDCSHPSKSRLRYLYSFFKFLKFKGQADVILVGFFGHFLVPLVKFFTRKPVLFDSFVSVHLTMVKDRKKFKEGGGLAKCADLLDYYACKLSDHVFCDTNEDIKYLTRQADLDASKFSRLWVGSDDSVMVPRPGRENPGFTAEFHGEFQTLHGVEYIIQAAKLLPDVKFNMLGKGPMLVQCKETVAKEGINNVEFFAPVAYEQLPDFIARAHVSLGLFGDTLKTQIVIPHKVYEAIAMARPIITADTPAARELLTHRQNVFFCAAANAQSLADAIIELRKDDAFRHRIAQNGLELFKEKCRPRVLGEQIYNRAQHLLEAAPC